VRTSLIKLIIILFTCAISVTGDAQEETIKTENRRFEITKVKLDSKTLNLAGDEKIRLSFEITKDADVLVLIYNELGQEVKQFKVPAAKSGLHSIVWDGRNAQGKPAWGRVFLYIIEATDAGEKKVVYNPAKQTGGLVVKSEDYRFDKETGKIEYVLPKTCMVRIRAGLRDSVFVRTILDWEPQTAGRHTLIWDGKDVAGLFDIRKHPDLDLNLTCYTLPANTIIVSGQNTTLQSSGKGSKFDKSLWAREGKYLHYYHDPRNCHEPNFTVSFPQHKKTNEEGLAVLFGKVPIRVDIDPDDARNMINQRFEIVFYVDGVFLFEVEEGTSPFTCHWDTRGFSKGPHIMTVNLISYNDHIGVASEKIIIGDN
jgi:hypothetical protein